MFTLANKMVYHWKGFCILTMMFLSTMVYGQAASGRYGVFNVNSSQVEIMLGEPVDISPWAYIWRDDRNIQNKPESYFIPRRLERIDRIYRTTLKRFDTDYIKSIHYHNQLDMLKEFPPAPAGELLCGALWRGRISDYQLQLHWPDDKPTPPVDAIEVRDYPSSSGWFGWTVDRILTMPQVSEDGKVWTYVNIPGELMDSHYNDRIPAGTEMLAVFYDDTRYEANDAVVPEMKITSHQSGNWKKEIIEIEWGFNEKSEFMPTGTFETFHMMIESVKPLEDGRNGVVIEMLVSDTEKMFFESRLTVDIEQDGVTFHMGSLDEGPIFIPESGIFISKPDSEIDAKQYIDHLNDNPEKTFRQLIHEHPEAQSWEQVMTKARLSECPPGTQLIDYPDVEDPPVMIELSDKQWERAWRVSSLQLKGKNEWGGLAVEVALVNLAQDKLGLYDSSEKVYEYFLESPGYKHDGDFVDGKGSLEWAKDMRNDIAYSHDGCHASTGRLLYAMCDRYILSGDKEWFKQKIKRLKKAADWIIRQKKEYLKDVPNHELLFGAGLMPPSYLGDYTLPASDWQWYWGLNVYALQGLKRFADTLEDFNDVDGATYYRNQAKEFQEVLLKAVKMESKYNVVHKLRDGKYYKYLPMRMNNFGFTDKEFENAHHPGWDSTLYGSMILGAPFSVLDSNDPIVRNCLDITEQYGRNAKVRNLMTGNGMALNLSDVASTEQMEEGLITDDTWFWTPYLHMPKWSIAADTFLLEDDIPNFLNNWMLCFASIADPNGRFPEHWRPGEYQTADRIDNGTTAWFMLNFRNMLVMELNDGKHLWLGRGIPRSWLEQGKVIGIQDAPTYFGPVSYKFISNVQHHTITAELNLELRAGKYPEKTILRFRHPDARPLKSVTVNGKAWDKFDINKETIDLTGLNDKISVIARYE